MKSIFVKNKRYNSNRGFTIVEMVTVIAIFAAFTSVVLVNLTDFNTSISTENIAQDVALVVRESQAKAVSGVTDGNFVLGSKPSWGVRVDSEESVFYHFADLNNNGRYNAGGGCESPSNECRDIITLPSGYTFGKICAISLSSGFEDCGLGSVTLTFTRPQQIPYVVDQSSGLPTEYTRVSIEIVNQQGSVKNVVVGRLGEITVE